LCWDISMVASLFRYVGRSVLKSGRVGGLEDGKDSVKLSMLHHIAVVTPGNRRRYAEVFREVELPKVYLGSVGAIEGCWRDWGLEGVGA
jgi:hypothetical protein